MLFTWQPEYEIDVDEIDHQHRYLVALVNEYYRSLIANTSSVNVEPVLNELISYMLSHFRAEEQLMADSGYPGLAEHRGQHEELREKVLQLQEEFSRRGRAIPVRLAIFLRKWLMHHIAGCDREMGTYLKATEYRTGDGKYRDTIPVPA